MYSFYYGEYGLAQNGCLSDGNIYIAKGFTYKLLETIDGVQTIIMFENNF